MIFNRRSGPAGRLAQSAAPVVVALSIAVPLALWGGTRGWAAAHRSPVGATATMQITRITTSAPVGQDILVAVSDISASTGYVWTAQRVSGLGVSYDEFLPRQQPGRPPIAGAPATRVYHIKILKASSRPYIERFVLNRSFGHSSPTAEVIVTITVTM